MHHGYWHDGGESGWWIPMVIMMVVFALGLAWVIFTLVRHNSHHAAGVTMIPPAHQPAPHTVDPRQVLAERLARGDIDVADYRARLDALDNTPPRR